MIKSEAVEWKIGSPPPDGEEGGGEKGGEEEECVGTIVIFPVSIEAMYTKDNYTYCLCIKCFKLVERGFVALLFQNAHWGVRIACTECYKRPPDSRVMACQYLLLELQAKIAPALYQGISIFDSRCFVCSKKRCKNTECKLILENNILYENEEQLLLEHFYRIQLNLHTVLLPPASYLCSYCHMRQGTRSCATCKMYIYCSKGCKKKASREDHPCQPFWEIWRL